MLNQVKIIKMKKLIVLLFLAATFTSDAQTLKELLYSGKLKKDSSAVIRKTDDLSTKIDTVQKKEPLTQAVTKKESAVDSAVNVVTPKTNSVTEEVKETVEEADVNESVEEEAVVVEKAAPVKSNTKLWKEYTDSLTSSLKEFLSSKKIKKDTYFFLVEYEIDENAQVSVTRVTLNPENELLLNTVRERILTSPPVLNVALDSAGQPRKVKRRQSFSVVKD